MPKKVVVNRPYGFFTCPCGFQITLHGGDENRIRKIRDMKMRLHYRTCDEKRSTDEITSYNKEKEVVQCKEDVQTLIRKVVPEFGSNHKKGAYRRSENRTVKEIVGDDSGYESDSDEEK